MRYPNFSKEKSKLADGYKVVLGCDEAGRGCLAGPVVAAAVVLNPNSYRKLHEVRDSKLLSAEKRFALDPLIKEHALGWGIGLVPHTIIDEINIHHASLLAMRQAVLSCLEKFDAGAQQAVLFVDGMFKVPNLFLEQEPVVDADVKILSVSAASVIAKVYRDQLMIEASRQFPQYSFEQHKGYGTVIHRKALQQFGPSKIHRLSFI